MFFKEAHETAGAEVFGRDRGVHVAGASIPPRSATVDRGFPGAFFRQATFDQSSSPGFGAFPLSPEHTAQATAEPHVQFFEGDFHVRESEIVEPADQFGLQIGTGPIQAQAACLREEHPEG